MNDGVDVRPQGGEEDGEGEGGRRGEGDYEGTLAEDAP